MNLLTRRLVTGILGLAISAAAFAMDGTYIAAGQSFLLGGEQRAKLLVEGRNIGSISVEILREINGKRRPLQTVAPGQSFSRTFAAGEIAVFRNTSSSRQAVLKFQLTQDVSRLSMRYAEPVPAK